MRNAWKLAAGALALAAAQTGQAVVLLSDNFDADSPTTVLNFNAFINWTVDHGTVDYIRSGNPFGISCVGTGGCVDSDGSTSDAGRLLSKATFSFAPDTSFSISVDASGNQRTSTPDTLTIGLTDASGTVVAASVTCARGGFDPYSSCGFSAIATGTFRAFIEGAGSDNIGAMFDNVLLTAEIAGVPEPAPLGLLALAFSILGWRSAKRRGVMRSGITNPFRDARYGAGAADIGAAWPCASGIWNGKTTRRPRARFVGPCDGG
jgi:hypothetical protein